MRPSSPSTESVEPPGAICRHELTRRAVGEPDEPGLAQEHAAFAEPRFPPKGDPRVEELAEIVEFVVGEVHGPRECREPTSGSCPPVTVRAVYGVAWLSGGVLWDVHVGAT